MSDNIIFNKKLEEYNKKYRNGRYKLLKYTKKEVEQYDKVANQTYKTKNYLLKGRKWALIGDTYYEIPKAPRMLWLRNINAGAKAATCALLGGAVAGGAGYGIYAAIAGNQPIKPSKHVDVVVPPEIKEQIEIVSSDLNNNGDLEIVCKANDETKEVDSIVVSVDTVIIQDAQWIPSEQKIVISNEHLKKEGYVVAVDSLSLVPKRVIKGIPESKQVTIGEAITSPFLRAQPEGGRGSYVSFSIEDNSIATITDNGDNTCDITLIKAGTTNIVVDYENALKKYCKLTVNKKQGVRIDNPPQSDLHIGDTGTLTATTTPSAKVTWSSSNSDYLSINKDTGSYEAKSAGTVTITASANGDTDTCSITIAEETTESITLTPKAITVSSARKAEKGKINVKLTGGATIDKVNLTADSGYQTYFTFEKSEKDSSIIITPVPGAKTTSPITLTATLSGSKISDTCAVTITDEEPEPQIDSHLEFTNANTFTDLGEITETTKTTIKTDMYFTFNSKGEDVDITLGFKSEAVVELYKISTALSVKLSGTELDLSKLTISASDTSLSIRIPGTIFGEHTENDILINPKISPQPQNLSISAESFNIKTTQSETLRAYVSGGGDESNIRFTATTPDIVTLEDVTSDSQGKAVKITGKNKGETDITVAWGEQTKTCKVQVKDINEVDVCFVLHDPEYTVYETKVITKGSKVTAPTNDPTISGKTFEGWYTESKDSESAYKFDFENTIINEDTYIHAHFRNETTETEKAFYVSGYENLYLHNISKDANFLTKSFRYDIFDKDEPHSSLESQDVEWKITDLNDQPIDRSIIDISTKGRLNLKNNSMTLSIKAVATSKYNPSLTAYYQSEISTSVGKFSAESLLQGKLVLVDQQVVNNFAAPSRYYDWPNSTWVTIKEIDDCHSWAGALNNIYIPSTIESISAGAFGSLTALTTVTFEDKNGWSATKDGTTIPIDASDLADGETAANTLKTYWEHKWTKETH